ncbi:hypothetical protein C6A77_15675 [Pseudomonas sp. AFG_SD02_1510_Pfu_092]|uniref:hypothetical protein n=1 Tax=Pseudomonas sp. AFG_SD02_1510_Pfu_092 TaxID=2259497 RepID=UPI000DEF11FA|nr:hypothetical protein [Pseudomonas sp. AFG_SD02_1510_Pfu_092]RCL24716.1 hypothetical protein C6A77_15675 [Pseudomonas sp. AFG_SD02_1510_Pfu_092]
MNPITAIIRTTPTYMPAATAPPGIAVTAATSAAASSEVSIGQSPPSADIGIYNAKGALGNGQVRYVWEQDGIDKLSLNMYSAIQASSTASRFQGLGAALLEQLATNGGQRIAQSGLAVDSGSATEPTLLGLQQARLREFATDRVTFTLNTASGATVSLGLFNSDRGLAVDAEVLGGELTASELKGLASMAESFQSAVNGLAQEPPSLKLGALLKLDPTLFTGLHFEAQLQTTSGARQTFALQMDEHTRSLELQAPSGNVKMNFDTQGGVLLGSEAQRQAAVSNYLSQFDAAQQRGNGDEQLMTLFKDAFRQLNSVDDATLRPADHDSWSNRTSRLLLSGMADFNASLTTPEQRTNPMRPDEVDSFAYNVSQTTARKGTAANLSLQQDQQSTLKAAWHESLNPWVELRLNLDSESQDYRYHEVRDEASSSTRIGFVNNVLVEATATQQASQQERVRTYQKAELQSDVTTSASAEQSRDLLDTLEKLLAQDRQARRLGLASSLEQQLQALRSLWLLQANPALIDA